MGVATYIKDEKDAIKEVILQSGIKVKPVYTPDDLEEIGFDYKEDLGVLFQPGLEGDQTGDPVHVGEWVCGFHGC